MAITLAGSGNDRVDFGDIAAIAGATAITVAVTLKPSAINAATNNRVIHQWASSTFGAFLIQVVDTDELGFTVRNGSSLYGPKTTALNLTAGNTYRIVARIGGLGGTKTQSIWVNGSAATTTAWFSGSPTSIQNSTSSVQIGHETAETSDGVDGDYSEAAIWLESVPDWVAEAYGQGYTALVYQKNQILYAPLENTSRTNDIVGGLTGTLTGGATADHPRIIYPAWPEIILSAAAAADSSGAGSSSGSSTVAGAGASINAQAGVSAGSASVSGVGASTNAQAGSSSGTATVSGVGASIHEAAGASAGTATVSGVGDSTSAGSAAGSSAGTATVSGVGASVHTAVGTAAGISSASGVSFVDEAQIEVVLSLRGGSGGGGSGPEYRGDSIAYRYGVSTPGIAVRREPLEETDDTEESPEPEKSVVPEAQPSLTLEDVRRAYRKLAALEVSEPIRATRDEIEREIAEAQADQAALRALMIRIDAVLTEIRQEEDEIAMLLMMAATT
jgi:hypothetical protein